VEEPNDHSSIGGVMHRWHNRTVDDSVWKMIHACLSFTSQ